MSKYILSTVTAGILWGIISVFIKPLSDAGIGTIQIMMLRALISAVIMFVYLMKKDKSLLVIHLKDLWMFIGTGIISLTFFSLCYFRTILEVGSCIAVILLYTSPIFVVLFSCILFKERFTSVKIIALLMTFTGCILVTGLGSKNGFISTKGILIGICAGIGYALYSIFSRYALEKYSSLTVTFYTFLFSGISLIPFGDFQSLCIDFSWQVLLLFLGVSLICTVLPYVLYTLGLSGLETGKAAIMVTVEPLVGSLVGIFLWQEEINTQKIIGMILIFVSVVILGKSRE